VRDGDLYGRKRDLGVDAVPAFLLLGVIWAAVLLPPWLQSRREARPNASMVTFRRQLWSLARTSPGYRPMYTDAFGGFDDDADDYADDMADECYDGDDDGGAAALAGGGGRLRYGDELARRRVRGSTGSGSGHAPASPRAAAAEGSYRRRRHILSGLTVLAIASVAPAVLLGGAGWIGLAVAGGLLLTYLALLVRRQRRLAERLRKVRYLAPIRAPRPAVVVLGTGTGR
jgi:hypothetical protein